MEVFSISSQWKSPCKLYNNNIGSWKKAIESYRGINQLFICCRDDISIRNSKDDLLKTVGKPIVSDTTTVAVKPEYFFKKNASQFLGHAVQ